MSHCADCGSKLSKEVCPFCHEELYILTEQAEFVESVSQEFMDLADSQAREIREKRRNDE